MQVLYRKPLYIWHNDDFLVDGGVMASKTKTKKAKKFIDSDSVEVVGYGPEDVETAEVDYEPTEFETTDFGE
jgi:hypothetical protein